MGTPPSAWALHQHPEGFLPKSPQGSCASWAPRFRSQKAAGKKEPLDLPLEQHKPDKGWGGSGRSREGCEEAQGTGIQVLLRINTALKGASLRYSLQVTLQFYSLTSLHGIHFSVLHCLLRHHGVVKRAPGKEFWSLTSRPGYQSKLLYFQTMWSWAEHLISSSSCSYKNPIKMKSTVKSKWSETQKRLLNKKVP